MADLADVMAWFEQECTTICYPSGTGQPSILGAGKTITLGRGWPDPKSLDTVMSNQGAMVTIYPPPGMERNTTRYPKLQQPVTINAPTLTLTVNGQQVTVGGTAGVGQAPMIIVGGTGYAYQVLVSDNLNSIAAALAALIPGASAVGAVVTVPTGPLISAKVSTTGTAAIEVRRQERVFGVYIWAASQIARDVVAQAIDLALAQIERFVLPDQFYARIIYKGSTLADDLQVRKIYKRTLMYTVEYATTVTETDSVISQQTNNITVDLGNTPVQ